MYVLFEQGQDTACGYDSRVKPFMTGIKLDDISMLTKDIEEEYWVDENKGGLKWYVDKHGMPTTDHRDAKPLQKKISVHETIDFAHYPNKFTKLDIMKYKKQLLLDEYNCDDCYMYEFGLNKFVNRDKSKNIQILEDDIQLFQNGVLVTTPINIHNYKHFEVIVDAEEDVQIYYAYDGEHFAKSKKHNTIVDEGIDKIYLQIKNKFDGKNMVYAYHVLLKE